jgi:hypothetical protein
MEGCWGTGRGQRRSYPVFAVSALLLSLMWLLLCRVANAQTPAPKRSAVAPNLRPRAKVMLDAWFNSQKRKNAAGQMEYFHYR